MIVFKKLLYKNFLSTGNVFTELNLNKNNLTLIQGNNGEGKSTFLDALTFVLFNKPFRNITKPQLVNSINKKDLVVTLEFSEGNNNYKIIRGIKPTIFEIYQDGKLLNQEASTRDYQQILESQILKMSYRTFTQVVILGSASFTPFMQLPLAQRREIVESILDIGIFSTMNLLLKERISNSKSCLVTIESDIKLLKNNIDNKKELILTIKSNNDKNKDILLNKIKQINLEILEKSESLKVLEDEVISLKSTITNENELVSKLKKIETAQGDVTGKLNHIKKHLDNLIVKDNCPTCLQNISNEHKDLVSSNYKEQEEELKQQLDKLEGHYVQFKEQYDALLSVKKQIDSKRVLIDSVQLEIKLMNNQLKSLEKEIQDISENTLDLDLLINELKVLGQDLILKNNEKIEIINERGIQDIAVGLLKDESIKTSIVTEYLPIINNSINKYLSQMNAYFDFTLDEKFNETIKSRFRDEFSYSSFSEGEKQRIDLALLFAWRDIAKLKNSLNTNLLIMDEIFDSSLDASNTEYLMNILVENNSNTNLFIISHKGDTISDKFEKVITFEKVGDFSTIKDSD